MKWPILQMVWIFASQKQLGYFKFVPKSYGMYSDLVTVPVSVLEG